MNVTIDTMGVVAEKLVKQVVKEQGWKLMSCGHCQELGQQASMAPDWVHKREQPVRKSGQQVEPLLTI